MSNFSISLTIQFVLVRSPWRAAVAQQPPPRGNANTDPVAPANGDPGPTPVPTDDIEIVQLSKTIYDETVGAVTAMQKWTERADDARANLSAVACFDSLQAPESLDAPTVSSLQLQSLKAALEALEAPYQGLEELGSVKRLTRAVDDLSVKIDVLSGSTLSDLGDFRTLTTQIIDTYPLDVATIEREYRATNNKALPNTIRTKVTVSATDAAAARAKLAEAVSQILEPRWNYQINEETKPKYTEAKNLATKAKQQYDKAIVDVREKFMKDIGCDRPDILCFDADGNIGGAGLGSPIRAGTRFQVLAFGEIGKYENHTITFELTEIKEISVVIEPGKTATGEQRSTDACTIAVPDDAVGYEVLQTKTFTVPKTLGVTDIAVEYTLSKAGKNVATGLGVTEIDHGKYYIDVGLFVPFVPFGKRTVTARPVGGERYLVVDSDLHITAGLAMNVFPGGRRRGELTPWSNRPPCWMLRNTKNNNNNNAKKQCHAAVAGELIGLQLGADLDIRDPIDQFYFGLVFEPVTGLTLSIGGAVIAMDDLGPGRAEGQLVASDADLDPSTKYRVRPYTSFGLSLDLVQALRAARERFIAERP